MNGTVTRSPGRAGQPPDGQPSMHGTERQAGVCHPDALVDKTPLNLRDKAFEIKEIIGGQVNMAYVANVDGCRVIWRTISLNKQ